jgi:hypothetical protein
VNHFLGPSQRINKLDELIDFFIRQYANLELPNNHIFHKGVPAIVKVLVDSGVLPGDSEQGFVEELARMFDDAERLLGQAMDLLFVTDEQKNVVSEMDASEYTRIVTNAFTNLEKASDEIVGGSETLTKGIFALNLSPASILRSLIKLPKREAHPLIDFTSIDLVFYQLGKMSFELSKFWLNADSRATFFRNLKVNARHTDPNVFALEIGQVGEMIAAKYHQHLQKLKPETKERGKQFGSDAHKELLTEHAQYHTQVQTGVDLKSGFAATDLAELENLDSLSSGGDVSMDWYSALKELGVDVDVDDEEGKEEDAMEDDAHSYSDGGQLTISSGPESAAPAPSGETAGQVLDQQPTDIVSHTTASNIKLRDAGYEIKDLPSGLDVFASKFKLPKKIMKSVVNGRRCFTGSIRFGLKKAWVNTEKRTTKYLYGLYKNHPDSDAHRYRHSNLDLIHDGLNYLTADSHKKGESSTASNTTKKFKKSDLIISSYEAKTGEEANLNSNERDALGTIVLRERFQKGLNQYEYFLQHHDEYQVFSAIDFGIDFPMVTVSKDFGTGENPGRIVHSFPFGFFKPNDRRDPRDVEKMEETFAWSVAFVLESWNKLIARIIENYDNDKLMKEETQQKIYQSRKAKAVETLFRIGKLWLNFGCYL